VSDAADLHYKRPGFSTRVFNRIIGWTNRLGLRPAGAETLAIRGRKSGEWRTNPVNPSKSAGTRICCRHEGRRSGFATCALPAVGGAARGSTVRQFKARELPGSEKLPLLRLYLDEWAWRSSR
jgi:hypothetical protein